MTANKDVKINKNYKDTIFRKLFGESKENALSLYNAVNGTSYTNEDELEFTTLEDVIYMKAKNDVSFIFDSSLSLYEHQSTYNPNMPLRGLLYFADLYRKILPNTESLYMSKLVRIPAPKYIVFYNGDSSKMPDDVIELKLSSAFIGETEPGKFEWTATMINIRADRNRDILKKCRMLKEYSTFVEEVIENNKTMNIKDAVNKSVEDCIKNNVLKEFLTIHRKEVVDMCLTEFDEIKWGELMKGEGREEGKTEGKQNTVFSLVKKGKLTLDEAAEELGLDVSATEKLLSEHGISIPSVV